MDFPLAEWERFVAKVNAQGELARIDFVRTDPAAGRIYGSGVLVEPAVPGDPPVTDVWLDPRAVPTRVLRGDNAWPRLHPLQVRQMIEHAVHPERELDDEEREAAEVAALLAAAVPEPEQRAVPATLEWMGENIKGALDQAKRAHKAGFVMTAMRARGPRMNNRWQVADISDSLRLDGRHADGRRFIAHWVTKTATERAKNAGEVKFGFDWAYVVRDAIVTRCNATELSAYCK